MYFFIYKNISIGGIETLILREAYWINKHLNSKSMIICNKISQQMKSSFEDHNIEYRILPTWSSKEISNTIHAMEPVEMIKYFSFEDYLQFIIHDPHLFEMTKCMYYCVHPNNVCILQNGKGIRGVFSKSLRNISDYLIAQKRILFMDEETLFRTLDFYKIKMKDSYLENILRLPYIIKDFSFKTPDISGKRSILTIARAEFPFKGYLLGLMKTMPNIMEQYPDVTLTMISGGDGFGQLDTLFKQMPEKFRSRIELLKEKKPEELEYYYQKADIYIGMGTTVLEAANHGVPSIMVKPDTTEFISNGLFHISPEDIGNFSINGISGQSELIKLINYPVEKWQEIQQETKRSLIKCYDAESIMQYFFNIGNQNVSTNSIVKDLFKIKILILLKKIKRN